MIWFPGPGWWFLRREPQQVQNCYCTFDRGCGKPDSICLQSRICQHTSTDQHWGKAGCGTSTLKKLRSWISLCARSEKVRVKTWPQNFSLHSWVFIGHSTVFSFISDFEFCTSRTKAVRLQQALPVCSYWSIYSVGDSGSWIIPYGKVVNILFSLKSSFNKWNLIRSEKRYHWGFHFKNDMVMMTTSRFSGKNFLYSLPPYLVTVDVPF